MTSSATHRPKTLIAIDAVSIAGASDTPIETLRPDYYLWSLQKDFACPTIGSVMIVSDRAFDVAATVPDRGYVLDLIEWRTRAETAQTPMTVADLTLQCLNARLEEMKREGDKRFKRHQSLACMQREWARKHGLSLIAKPEYESLTVNAIRLPDQISGSDFVNRAKKLLNVQLAPGLWRHQRQSLPHCGYGPHVRMRYATRTQGPLAHPQQLVKTRVIPCHLPPP